MAKICKKCNASINSKSMECPYCGSTSFEVESVEPAVTVAQQPSQSNDNNDGVYSTKLEQLISLALSDGELTEKEKQVLFKKAEAEGIDLDEFEMVLDAKLKQLQISNAQTTTHYSGSQPSNTPPPPPPVNMTASAIPSREAYSQLEYLIDMGLKDGSINDYERQTIVEKGIVLGISRNEIEMILANKIDEKSKLLAQTAAPKSDKFGDVKKCPACGSMIQSFTAICADCGHSFSNINAVSSVTKLHEQLLNVESEERNRPVETGWMEKLQGNSAATDMQLEERIKKRKASVVTSFPVPNTKEDILEFLSMAIPEAGKKPNFFMMGTATGALYKAWLSKAEQVIMKARFSLKEDKKLLDEINNYAKELGIK